jgi:thiol-disulfide isomerase/thioredoxin
MKLEAIINTGDTFIVVLADWCGHCKNYKPIWEQLENTPGRTKNIARVDADMLVNVPSIKNARIDGYPSVIKVSPRGEIEEYNVKGSDKITNAVPYMRDINAMKRELTAPPPTLSVKNVMKKLTPRSTPKKHAIEGNAHRTVVRNMAPPPEDSGRAGTQGGIVGDAGLPIKNALMQTGGMIGDVLRRAGPAALLSLAYSFLPKRNVRRTFKSPKRASHRGSTRRNRRR